MGTGELRIQAQRLAKIERRFFVLLLLVINQPQLVVVVSYVRFESLVLEEFSFCMF